MSIEFSFDRISSVLSISMEKKTLRNCTRMKLCACWKLNSWFFHYICSFCFLSVCTVLFFFPVVLTWINCNQMLWFISISKLWYHWRHQASDEEWISSQRLRWQKSKSVPKYRNLLQITTIPWFSEENSSSNVVLK